MARQPTPPHRAHRSAPLADDPAPRTTFPDPMALAERNTLALERLADAAVRIADALEAVEPERVILAIERMADAADRGDQ